MLFRIGNQLLLFHNGTLLQLLIGTHCIGLSTFFGGSSLGVVLVLIVRNILVVNHIDPVIL